MPRASTDVERREPVRIRCLAAEVLPPDPASAPKPPRRLRRKIKGPLLGGMVVITVFFGAFGAWGSLVTLAGGATAKGVISPEGSRKIVQHLEGGRIGAILVRDGDVVTQGQALLVLEDVQARATFEMLRAQRDKHRAVLARLRSEEQELPTVRFPADQARARAADAELDTLLTSQEQLFAARRQLLESQKEVLRQGIHQLREEITGIEAQVESATRQLAIIAEELEGKLTLWHKQLLPKPELLALRRREAEIIGDRGEYEGAIARARRQISETELKVLAMDAERREQIAKERDEVEALLVEAEEKLLPSADVLTRTVIAAPTSGTVVDLAFKTAGGVIRPGERILDIVPLEDELLIDARVGLLDIDVVHPGLAAKVKLSAFASRRMPSIEGVVRSVSADRLSDGQTGEAFYLARIEVDRERMRQELDAGEVERLARIEVDRERMRQELGPGLELVPGMPADVLIVTGHRTPLEYLLQPLRDALDRSLREG